MPNRIIDKQKPSIITGGVLFVLAALAAIYLVVFSHAASSDTANLWVDMNGGSCARQVNAAIYSDAQACDSLNAAYQAANPGDRVYVKGGNYTSVPLIASDADKNGAVSPVTIEEAPGESAILDDLATAASNIIIIGFEVDNDGGVAPVGGPDIKPGSHDVMLDGIRSTTLFITGNTKNVTVKNSEFGPYKSANGSQIKTEGSGGDDPNPASWPDNTVLDNVYFHDYTTVSSQDHTDCMHVFYHIRLTIRKSRFINCPYYGVLLGSNGSGSAEHDLIENNVFAGSGNATDFGLRGGTGEDFSDVIVRYNSGGYITPQTTNTLSGVQWIANAATDLGGCRANVYRYNISTNTNCGGVGDLQANPLFVNPVQNNYALQTNSLAIDRGDPSTFPSTDLLGTARPIGLLPDAGAYEYNSGGVNPPPPPTCTRASDINCDGSVNIQDVTVVLSNFGKPASQASDSRADTSGNGSVDIPDLTVVLSAFGT
jgi:hypothetical protein